MYTQTDIAERERTVKEFDVLLVGKKKASPLKSIRDPLRRKIKLLLERTDGRPCRSRRRSGRHYRRVRLSPAYNHQPATEKRSVFMIEK
jgi:hypothetical protein